MSTKREEIRDFIKREAAYAVHQLASTMSDRTAAETIRVNVGMIAGQIAWHIAEEYRFLELADIMEWKRTRVRR